MRLQQSARRAVQETGAAGGERGRGQVKVKVSSGGAEAELRVAVRGSETGHHLRHVPP